MEHPNLRGEEFEEESSRPGYRWRASRIGARLGAQRIGASLYELGAGERSFPYHFHHGVEEWCHVVSGEPLLRTPAGERRLRPGDVVCFPAGAAGAHVLTGPARVLMLSSLAAASVSVYPDSDKLGTRPREAAEDRLNFRRADAVDYWEGE